MHLKWLPLAIREELNTRLFEGDPAHLLIEWLNTDCSVLAVLNAQFEGRLILEAEVSARRQGGYMEWALVRECAATSRGLSDSSHDITVTGISAEHLLTVITAHYAKILNELQTAPLDELERRVNLLKKLTNAALALRRREFQAARLELDRDRHELAREKQLSKSSSSRSSRASASTESTAATKSGAKSNPVDPVHPVRAAAASFDPSDASTPRFPFSDLRSPISDPRLPTCGLSGFRSPRLLCTQLPRKAGGRRRNVRPRPTL